MGFSPLGMDGCDVEFLGSICPLARLNRQFATRKPGKWIGDRTGSLHPDPWLKTIHFSRTGDRTDSLKPDSDLKTIHFSRTGDRTDSLKPDSDLKTIHFSRAGDRTDSLKPDSDLKTIHFFRTGDRTDSWKPDSDPQTHTISIIKYVAAFLVKFGGVHPVSREWPFVSNLRGLLRAAAIGVAARFMMV